jgi:hypothetical protein
MKLYPSPLKLQSGVLVSGKPTFVWLEVTQCPMRFFQANMNKILLGIEHLVAADDAIHLF